MQTIFSHWQFSVAAVLFVAGVALLVHHRLRRSKQALRASFVACLRGGLDMLQKQERGYSHIAHCINAEIALGHCSWQDLHTDPEKVEELAERLKHKEIAMSIIDWARQYNGNLLWDRPELLKIYLVALPAHLESAGLNLSGIGSSGEEVASFPRKIAIIEAKKKWHHILANAEESKAFLAELHDWRKSEDLTLADLGISEAELMEVSFGLK